jgi:Arc/MetJ-type ribon-helix-helix transcriptional regulator
MLHMKQILVQLDDRTAALLETVAPGRSRKRSEFIRLAVARALMEMTERKTRAAYAAAPAEPSSFDLAEWANETEAVHPPRRRAR